MTGQQGRGCGCAGGRWRGGGAMRARREGTARRCGGDAQRRGTVQEWDRAAGVALQGWGLGAVGRHRPGGSADRDRSCDLKESPAAAERSP